MNTIRSGIWLGTRSGLTLEGLGFGLVGLAGLVSPAGDGSSRSGASGSRYSDGDDMAAWCLKGKCLWE